MRNFSLRRTIGAAAVTTLTLAATLALAACGGDGGGGLTDPPPSDDPPPTEDPPQAPAPQGSVIYALDNGNRLLVFGTESGSTISRLVNISGMPILKRMIGIDFRPSNRKLYGVGNDSRVYVIDTLSGAATPVGSGPFSPAIISSFDIHFGMDFDPATGRIRLISNELGGNLSIDPDDGTAVAGPTPRYAAGDPNEGETPHIGGLTYVPASAIPASSAVHLKVAQLAAASGPCEDLLWAMDTKLSNMITSCDPDDGDWTSLGPIEGISSLACVELDYSGPGGGIWAAGQGINDAFNSIGTVDPKSGKIDWKVNVPDNWLIQSITFEPKVEPVGVRAEPAALRLSVESAPASSAGEPEGDPVALCRGAGAN
jgi:hypothetical protein